MFSSIALGGGGVRGGIMIGGLASLAKQQPLTFPNGIYGCSAGSILATAIAYNIPIENIRKMFDDEFNLSNVVPSLNLSSLTGFTQQKGLFSMDSFTETIVKAFDSQGIDLRNAVINDTPQKLYILASNLTTRRPAFLTGRVRVLDAICCSSCLPFVFHPQVMYGNVFIDGGFYTTNIYKIVSPDTLVFQIGRRELSITPENLKRMNLTQYSATLYESTKLDTKPDNVLFFKNDEISMLQELTKEQKQKLYDEGFARASVFFAKRLADKLE